MANVETDRIVAGNIVRCDTLLEMGKKRNVKWFGHVVIANGTLANTTVKGTVEGKDHEEGQQDSGWP